MCNHRSTSKIMRIEKVCQLYLVENLPSVLMSDYSPPLCSIFALDAPSMQRGAVPASRRRPLTTPHPARPRGAAGVQHAKHSVQVTGVANENICGKSACS